MSYINSKNFDHDRPARTGVLLTNLGTPTAPDKAALRVFLKEFLSDPRVVEAPRLLWWFILNGIILNTRPARSAAAYREIWTERGSPLQVYTEKQVSALREELSDVAGGDLQVDYAFRYGQPSLSSGIQSMCDRGVQRLLVLPLYPQYSGPTTASTFDALAADFTRRRWIPQWRFVHHYHDEPLYIAALADSIRQHWEDHGRAGKLLLSYHGVPQSYLEDGDPYYCECQKTSRLVAEALGLAEEEYQTVFQSRFGRAEWVKPYTDITLQELPGQGIDSVQVICPGFASDCLETLEEIGIENRDLFLQAGGERYEYIPCLNDAPGHIRMLGGLVRQQLQCWG